MPLSEVLSGGIDALSVKGQKRLLNVTSRLGAVVFPVLMDILSGLLRTVRISF